MRTIALALLAALLLGLAGLTANMLITPASAKAPQAMTGDLTYHQGTFRLRLTDRPCPDEELAAQLEEEGIPPARQLVATQLDLARTGCWAKDMAGDILARDHAGTYGDLAIPAEWFRREQK